MDVVDCTRFSRAWARRRVLSRAICQLPEQMSQVASSGDGRGGFWGALVASALPYLFFPVIPLIIPTNALSMRRDCPPVCDTCVLFAAENARESLPTSWPPAKASCPGAAGRVPDTFLPRQEPDQPEDHPHSPMLRL